jgi:putative methyltransferase
MATAAPTKVLVVDLAFKESHDVILPHVYGSLRTYLDEFFPETSALTTWLPPIYRWQDLVSPNFKDADVLALSCYVWSIESQLKLAKEFKTQNPGGVVICGGPQVEKAGGQYQDLPFVDFWVFKEGEEPFARIMTSLVSQGPEATKLRKEEFEQHIPPPHLPRKSPYLLGYYDPLVAENRTATVTAIWETTRGCPFNCSFCNWGSYTSSKVREVDIERIHREIAWFGEKRIGHLYITDANFGILPRDVAIARLLAKTNNETGYPKQVWANYNKNTNERVLEINDIFVSNLMSYSGATISVQSLNSETLSAVGRENIGFKKYLEVSDHNEKKNITSYTELILGLPGETIGSFVNGVDLLVARRVRNIRMYPALVLNNTQFSEPLYRKQYGIKTKPKRLYIESHPIINANVSEYAQVITKTSTMSSEEFRSMYTLGHLTQALYCTGLLKTTFDLALSHRMPFSKFLEDFEKKGSPFVQSCFSYARELVRVLFDTDETNMFGAQFREFRFADRTQRLRAAPWNLLWLKIMLAQEEFFASLEAYLVETGSMAEDDAAELIALQKFLLLDLDLWSQGKKAISLSGKTLKKVGLIKQETTPLDMLVSPITLSYEEPIKSRSDSLVEYLMYSTGSSVVTEFKFVIRSERIQIEFPKLQPKKLSP